MKVGGSINTWTHYADGLNPDAFSGKDILLCVVKSEIVYFSSVLDVAVSLWYTLH